MTYQTILLDIADGVGRITLNRPDKLNSFTAEMHAELRDAIEKVAKEARAMLLTGAGRGFCAGQDLSQRRQMGGAGESPPDLGHTIETFYNPLVKRMRSLELPIVGAVNGVAAGAGMSLALACDMRIGSEAARFKVVFIERSLSPDSGLSYFLPRIVGYSRACDLVYTSRGVEAEEAYRIGLLDRVVPAERLVEEAKAIAQTIAGWPPMAMQMSKRVLQASMDHSLEEQLRYESTSLGFGRRAVNDVKEAAASFREKRKPVFTGT
jgi:2-(1,2-epoxy-1,2-dihydrophenyl)acetyl-CoA isomerase